MVEVLTEGDGESMHCQETVKGVSKINSILLYLGQKIAHGPIKSEF